VRAVVSAASVTNLVVTVPAGAIYAPITETVNGLTAYANQSFIADVLRRWLRYHRQFFLLRSSICQPAAGLLKVVIADPRMVTGSQI